MSDDLDEFEGANDPEFERGGGNDSRVGGAELGRELFRARLVGVVTTLVSGGM